MVARSILARRLRQHAVLIRPSNARFITSAPSPSPTEQKPSGEPTSSGPKSASQRPKSWLTRKIEESPATKSAVLSLAKFMGYGSAKQVAGRRAFAMYEQLCVVRPGEERAFWQNECDLPPTFQSWFTIVNLHVWLLTVRLRALPPPHGMHYIQALIDHFFLDIEDRVRAVLQPASPDVMSTGSHLGPYTPPTDFYSVANAPGKKRPKGKAPERLVAQQLKIFKEQWAGMGMSLDASLLRGDADMAGVIWRNILGGRGARGIVFPSDITADAQKPFFRRSVNLVGGDVEKVKKIDEQGLEVEEARDDGSGVHDYAPSDADRYVVYPELMARLVVYVRAELQRLQDIPDEVITGGGVAGKEGEGLRDLKFGKIPRGPLLS